MLASRLATLIAAEALHSQDPEDRYSTNGVSWQQYEALLAKLGDSPGCRVTYLDGVLEIVSPSLRHEGVKSRIGDLLLLYFLETSYVPYSSPCRLCQRCRCWRKVAICWVIRAASGASGDSCR